MKIALNWLNDFIDLEKIDVPSGKSKEDLAKYIADKFNWITIDCSRNNTIKTINEIHQDILTKLGLIVKIY